MWKRGVEEGTVERMEDSMKENWLEERRVEKKRFSIWRRNEEARKGTV
jgi:hypothetical protein